MTDASWGDDIGGELTPSDATMPGGKIDLGHGNSMTFNPGGWEALANNPAVIAALKARSQAIMNTANASVGLDPRTVARLDNGEAPYNMTMHFEGEGRPRGRVFPATILGAVDDAVNSTLLKSISNQPAGSAMPSESSGGPASTAADDDSAD